MRMLAGAAAAAAGSLVLWVALGMQASAANLIAAIAVAAAVGGWAWVAARE